MKLNSSEFLISVALVGAIVLFLDPFMVLMPPPMVYVLIVILATSFFIFAGFIWREKTVDERDEAHKMFAGHAGYLSGAAVLVGAIIFEALRVHTVDPWIILALSAMIVGKLFAFIYGSRYK